ncbi:MAG: type III CRISPR-associated RAMP protein Csx7 [Candidatus Helarchaeota archaeon]
MPDHRYLSNRLIVKGELITKSPLRIGGSREESPYQIADMGVIRIFHNGNLVPYIPGSSIKGVLRSTVEKIYKTLELKYICEITNPKNSCGGRFRSQLNKAMNNRDNEKLRSIIEENFCDVCKIFGTSGYRSNILINDAYPISNNSFKIEKRTGIGIDRIQGFVSRKALYTTEYLTPNSKFHFSMMMENLPLRLIRWVFLAIAFLNQQRSFIGSFSTKGFGRIELVFHEIGYNQFQKDAPELQLPQIANKSLQDYTRSVIDYFKTIN